MLKIGLIGTGFMGNMHSLCYEALAGKVDFQVTAVADMNEEKAGEIAKKFGAKVYSSASELIEQGDVNVVDICLPTFLHTEIALQAMEKGHHVFIEKPVSLTKAEAEQLLEKQRTTKTKVMVGHCIRFWPEYQELEKLVKEQTYGRVISGVFRRISPKPTWAWDQWLDDEGRSGSAALDLHIHDVDFVRHLFGEPDHIKSEVVNKHSANMHIFSLYNYGDAVISLEGGWDYPTQFPFEMTYRVKFEQAVAEFNSNAVPSLRIFEDSGKIIEVVLDSDLGEIGSESSGNISSLGGYYNELSYFLSCLSGDREIEQATLEDGCQSLMLTLRAIAAAEE
ncbi:Gfo/Idh/MocA family protein [Paenibacillus sp. GCM10027628]|uniref:Gfo/Idh/MocA family protein n=1 Tax=Paenibacillus sp. GCM10027628 TaxID=3273413 RepID=UPI003644D902